MPALYPMTSAPEDFCVGDTVRKWVSERSVTPYVGIVTNIHPGIHKLDVQWPRGNMREDPEEIIKVNPIFGIPSVSQDTGYGSYDKSLSEKLHGKIPKRVMPSDKMPIRIAHTFANKIIGNIVDDIVDCYKGNLNEVQAYNQVYRKYSNTCSDFIIRSSIQKVYRDIKGE